jgi:hypothetical protein
MTRLELELIMPKDAVTLKIWRVSNGYIAASAGSEPKELPAVFEDRTGLSDHVADWCFAVECAEDLEQQKEKEEAKKAWETAPQPPEPDAEA